MNSISFSRRYIKSNAGSTGPGLSIAGKTACIYDGDIRAYFDNGVCFEVILAEYWNPPADQDLHIDAWCRDIPGGEVLEQARMSIQEVLN